jgi:membrane protease YdiL (CAAX protease family)
VGSSPTRPTVAVLAAVTSTALAGYGLAWLRFRSGSLAAPAVAHASLNATAYLAARFRRRHGVLFACTAVAVGFCKLTGVATRLSL